MEFDYQKLGLKCGIETHQQLDTKKLFCACPSKLFEREPDYVFERKIKALASELGEYDAASLEAHRKGLKYIYEAFYEVNCQVDTDEEPIHKVNQEALSLALEIASMTKSKPVDKVFIMRKAISDGSCTSSFQRTMFIASHGFFEVDRKKINVQTIILEEDAARPSKKTDKEIYYRIDRLGIPLIEFVTGPDIRSPEEAKKVARKIGEIFRLTGKVKRGLGSIRQDLNISIANGVRTELKGVQELELIDEYVKREVQRQVKLLEIKDELNKRGAKEKDFDLDGVDLSKDFEKIDCKITTNGLKEGKKIYGLKLSHCKGLLGLEVQPGRRFGKELANYLKVKENVKGCLHSDEMPAYGITEKDVELIGKKLGLGRDDAFLLVCEKQDKTLRCLDIVKERMKVALKAIPEETRNATEEGNSEYLRPRPGAARMYPETDSESFEIDKKVLEEIKKNLPLSVEERKDLYVKKFKLSEKLAEEMKLNNYARFFEKLVSKGFDATTVATFLLQGLTQLRRENIEVEELSNEMIQELLQEMKKETITKDVLLNVTKKWLEDKYKPLEAVISSMNLGKIDDSEVRKIIRKVVEANKQIVKEKQMHALGALMGDVMKEVRGKASGQEVNKILLEEIKKSL